MPKQVSIVADGFRILVSQVSIIFSIDNTGGPIAVTVSLKISEEKTVLDWKTLIE